jgi:hypothetical protein
MHAGGVAKNKGKREASFFPDPSIKGEGDQGKNGI